MLTSGNWKDTVGVKVLKRGKICPICKTKVGPRTLVCACGHHFLKQIVDTKVTREEKAEQKKIAKEEERKKNQTQEEKNAELSKKILGCRGRIILYPGELCPVKLKNIDMKSVREWRSSVIEAGQTKNVFYAPSAIRYFVREFFPINTPKNQEVNWCLDDIWKEETETYRKLKEE